MKTRITIPQALVYAARKQDSSLFEKAIRKSKASKAELNTLLSVNMLGEYAHQWVKDMMEAQP